MYLFDDRGEKAVPSLPVTPGTLLRASLHGRLDGTGIDRAAWDLLVAQSEGATVFQTYDWHQSWCDAFGRDGLEPMCVVVSRGVQPVGVAPFVLRAGAINEIRFIGDGRSDYCDIIASASDKRAVIQEALDAIERTVRWDVLELNNVPAASATIDAMRQVSRAAGFHLSVDHHYVCPTLLIRGHEPSARRVYQKNSLQRPYRALTRVGNVECRTLTTELEVARLLEAFFAQHVERWSRTRTPSLFEDRRNRHFYRALASRLSAHGWLHFAVVELDEAPIAFHFGFDFADTLTWYKPSFKIELASLSPGMVLLRHLIGESIEQGRKELDFTIGDEAFKRRFTNSVRRTVRLRMFRNPSPLTLARSKRAVIDMAKLFTRGMALVKFPGKAGA